jgi:hypothetical protein
MCGLPHIEKTAESTLPDSADEMPNADLHPPNARLCVCVPLLPFTLISSLVKGFIGLSHTTVSTLFTADRSCTYVKLPE